MFCLFGWRGTSQTDAVDVTPGGGEYSHTLPIRVCAAQRGSDHRTGYPFQRRFLERGRSRLYLLLKIVTDNGEALILFDV